MPLNHPPPAEGTALLKHTLALTDLLDVLKPSLERTFAVELFTAMTTLAFSDVEELALLAVQEAATFNHPQVNQLVTIISALLTFPTTFHRPGLQA